jgi:hypothetical protein
MSFIVAGIAIGFAPQYILTVISCRNVGRHSAMAVVLAPED